MFDWLSISSFNVCHLNPFPLVETFRVVRFTLARWRFAAANTQTEKQVGM